MNGLTSFEEWSNNLNEEQPDWKRMAMAQGPGTQEVDPILRNKVRTFIRSIPDAIKAQYEKPEDFYYELIQAIQAEMLGKGRRFAGSQLRKAGTTSAISPNIMSQDDLGAEL